MYALARMAVASEIISLVMPKSLCFSASVSPCKRLRREPVGCKSKYAMSCFKRAFNAATWTACPNTRSARPWKSPDANQPHSTSTTQPLSHCPAKITTPWRSTLPSANIPKRFAANAPVNNCATTTSRREWSTTATTQDGNAGAMRPQISRACDPRFWRTRRKTSSARARSWGSAMSGKNSTAPAACRSPRTSSRTSFNFSPLWYAGRPAASPGAACGASAIPRACNVFAMPSSSSAATRSRSTSSKWKQRCRSASVSLSCPATRSW
mmetsp:Transcript_64827/g.198248  ORF Transcript_64827/g.198248 Transcript_64827/m.198248 type:complete len:267 (-) Transcript_64827:692-1492(-)